MNWVDASQNQIIEVDGSLGEGGGQVLRTCLTLSMITGKSFYLKNIRAHRSPKGLRPQHAHAVRISASICNATCSSYSIDSTELIFKPTRILSGKYNCNIPTAGSATLIAQTVVLPLALQEKTSTVTIHGGTHVPGSPFTEYLTDIWIPFLKLTGVEVQCNQNMPGYFPSGGGEIVCKILPKPPVNPLTTTERGKLLSIRGVSVVSNLDQSISKRMKHQLLRNLEPLNRNIKIKSSYTKGHSPGAYAFVTALFENGIHGYSGLGKKGKRAEIIADEISENIFDAMQNPGTFDYYLADQALLPLALIAKESHFSTVKVTEHLLTNAEIIKKFLSITIDIQGGLGNPGLIRIYNT